MNRILLCLAATAAAFTLGDRLSADDAGQSPWSIGVRGSQFVPVNKSTPFISNGGFVAPNSIEFSTFVYPEFDLGYQFTDNLSADLSVTYPQRSTVSAKGGGTLGTVDILPSTLTLDYSFMPGASLNPYLGAGLDTTFITHESNLGNSFGVPFNFKSNNLGEVLEAGVAIKLFPGLSATVSVRKAFVDSRLYENGLELSKIQINPWIFSVGISHRF